MMLTSRALRALRRLGLPPALGTVGAVALITLAPGAQALSAAPAVALLPSGVSLGIPLNAPVVGAAQTAAGTYLVATDGGVFSFGPAPFLGSLGALRLNSPIQAMVAAPGGVGYWMVAADGGVFAFGGAPFAGSAGGRGLSAPVVAMAPTPSGNGYWLAGADG